MFDLMQMDFKQEFKVHLSVNIIHLLTVWILSVVE